MFCIFDKTIYLISFAKTMKKLVLTKCLLLFAIALFSNPIVPPSFVFSEIKFFNSPTDWKIELYFIPEWQGWADDLSDFYLGSSSSGDTAVFKPGIPVLHNTPIVVTANALINPLSINKEGDIIRIFLIDGTTYNYLVEELSFGEIQEFTWVYSPDESQSVARHKVGFSGAYRYYWGLENNPSLGSNALVNSTRTNFSGYVYDAMGYPIPNVEVGGYNIPPPGLPLLTNNNGYFETNNMLSKKFKINVFLVKEFYLVDTIDIYIDSINHYEFFFDSLYVGKPEIEIIEPQTSLIAFPNPFKESLNIKIVSNERIALWNGQIRLCNLSGEVIYAKDINSPYLTNIDIQWRTTDFSYIKSGMYILQLTGNGKILATDKIIYKE